MFLSFRFCYAISFAASPCFTTYARIENDDLTGITPTHPDYIFCSSSSSSSSSVLVSHILRSDLSLSRGYFWAINQQACFTSVNAMQHLPNVSALRVASIPVQLLCSTDTDLPSSI